MTNGPRNAAAKIALFRFMSYRFLDAVAEACASFNFRAQSSQHTSTVLPLILTLMEFLSSLQSQAAQVVSTMASLSHTRSPGCESSRPCSKRTPLSESLAICEKGSNDQAPTGGTPKENGRKLRGTRR
jgi:hypothetical protein